METEKNPILGNGTTGGVVKNSIDESETMSDEEMIASNENVTGSPHVATKRVQSSPTPEAKSGKKKKGKMTKH